MSGRVHRRAAGNQAARIATLLRYGQDVDVRDYADTPELTRLFELYDANVKAGACGGCAMDWACHVAGREFGHPYVPEAKACTKRPPDANGCAGMVSR